MDYEILEQTPEYKRILRDFDGDKLELWYRKGVPGKSLEEVEEARARGEVVHRFNYCPPLNPRSYEPEENIICQQDVPCRLRDGATIYCDIYKPKYFEGRIPAILSWSMYGKRQSEGAQEWKLMGVPPQTVSKMAKFESADPAYWCHKGYAIVNVDPRGVGNSEGDVETFSLQEGEDGYDFIEWLAQEEWCNGCIGMFGNSGVGMPIWRIASCQPPHLTAIAPWECTGDMYREGVCVGGIPSPKFNEGIISGVACKNYILDFTKMLELHPNRDRFWDYVTPKWEKIKIPTYCCGGWAHFHLHGSIEGFRRIRSPKKWMRIHREFEWPDTYNRDNLADLTLFFDRYLKGVRNGWETTPKLRIDVMDSYDFDFRTRRVENEFPLARTEYKKLYLNAVDHTAGWEQPAQAAEVTYDPESEVTTFDFRFTELTEITGFMKLRLWVECRGHDNMDLFIWIKKLGQEGEYIPVRVMGEGYRGAWGYQRTSCRELAKNATDYQPIHTHQGEERMKPGEIFPVDIEIWPHSRIWHPGEYLRVEVGGRFVKTQWYEDEKLGFATDNGAGTHVIHTGGDYDSYLQIPVIPPKWTSGDFEVR